MSGTTDRCQPRSWIAALGAVFSGVLVVDGALGIVAGRVLDRAGPRPVLAGGLIAATGSYTPVLLVTATALLAAAALLMAPPRRRSPDPAAR